jgi:hypothetical protein
VAPGTGWQRFPQIAPDGLGGAYVAWVDEGTSETTLHSSVFVQHLISQGVADPAWPSTGVPPDVTAFKGLLHNVASDGRQGVIIGWYDFVVSPTQGQFQAQRLDSLGARTWGPSGVPLVTLPGAGPTNSLLPPFEFVPDSGGGAIAVWEDRRFTSGPILTNAFARRVDRDGNARWTQDGVRVCPGLWQQSGVHGVTDSAGGVIVAWGDERISNTQPSIYAQHLNKDGIPQWPATGAPVCVYPAGVPSIQGLCEDGFGGAFVSWIDFRTDPNGDVYLQHLMNSGAIDPSWPVDGLVVDSTSNTPGGGVLRGDGVGGVLVMWSSQRLPNTGYFAQHVTAGGAVTWVPGGVFVGPSLSGGLWNVSDGHGGFIYSSDEHPNGMSCAVTDRVRARRVSSTGATLWGLQGPVISIGCGSREFGSGCTDDAGGLITAWEDYRVPSSGFNGNNISNIYAQRVRADGTLGGDVVGTLLSLASADVTPDHVRIRWFGSDRSISGADVERESGDGWTRVGRVTTDGDGLLTYDDSDVLAGRRYGYRVNVTRNGQEEPMGETWVTIPAGEGFALQQVRPNPSAGELQVSFTLGAPGPTRLDVLDVAGRRVATRDSGMLAAGMHVVSFTRESSGLRPGVYSVRLTCASRTASIRAILIR